MHFPPDFKTIYPFLIGFSPLCYFSSVLSFAGTVLVGRRCFCLLVVFFYPPPLPPSSFALRSVWVSFKLSTEAHTCGPDGGLMEGEGSARWLATSLCVLFVHTDTNHGCNCCIYTIPISISSVFWKGFCSLFQYPFRLNLSDYICLFFPVSLLTHWLQKHTVSCWTQSKLKIYWKSCF